MNRRQAIAKFGLGAGALYLPAHYLKAQSAGSNIVYANKIERVGVEAAEEGGGGGVEFNNAGLVGWWGMNSGSLVNDDHTTGLDLTNVNSVSEETSSHKVGTGCGDFGGAAASQLLESSAGAVNITNALTVGIWLKAESLGSQEFLLSVDNGPGNRNWRLEQKSSNLRFLVFNGGSATTTADPATLSTATWYFVVGVFEPSNSIKLYVNNVLVAITTASVPAILDGITTATLSIGAQSSVAFRFDGLLDEAFVFSRALTDTNTTVGQPPSTGSEVETLWNDGDGLAYSDISWT